MMLAHFEDINDKSRPARAKSISSFGIVCFQGVLDKAMEGFEYKRPDSTLVNPDLWRV
jgi:hypothetical protein